MKTLIFPRKFIWGAAASAFQTEGAWRADGKGASNWDVFCRVPGKIKGGADGRVAIDHYHRYKADIALMARCGLQAYRLSISWPRVLPNGVGKPNPKGLAFYDRLIDAFLANNIRPFVNLHHWDMPDVLDRQGGWRNRDVVHAFADYAGLMSDRLSDRVQDWITFNEIKHIYEGCYQGGWNAPGLLLPPQVSNQALHHVLLAHGLAVQSIRARARSKVAVGLVHACWLRMPADENNRRDRAAAERCFRNKNGLLLDPLYKGRYPAHAWKPGEKPLILDEDMRNIATPLDFFGLNCYGGFHVAADDGPAGYREVMPAYEVPRTTLGWPIQPRSMYWGIKHVWDNYPVKRLHISENGCGGVDTVTHDGCVHDEDRIAFLSDHICEMHRAMQEGYPVDGYFTWSFFDNFEWTQGYGPRFGLVYVDYPTLRRIPKDSFGFYRGLIRSRRLPAAGKPPA